MKYKLIFMGIMGLILIQMAYASIQSNIVGNLTMYLDFRINASLDNSSYQSIASISGTPESPKLLKTGNGRSNKTILLNSSVFGGTLQTINFTTGGTTAPLQFAETKNITCAAWVNTTFPINDLRVLFSQDDLTESSLGMWYMAYRTTPLGGGNFTRLTYGGSCGADCDLNINLMNTSGHLNNTGWKLFGVNITLENNRVSACVVENRTALGCINNIATSAHTVVGAGKSLIIGGGLSGTGGDYVGGIANAFCTNYSFGPNDWNWTYNDGVPRNLISGQPIFPETANINFTIYDEFYGKFVTLNGSSVNFEIESSQNATNTTLRDANYYAEDLSAGDYRVGYSSSKFRKRNFYVTLLEGNTYFVDLYLLSITNGTLTTFTINDQNANPAINFTIKGQRYYPQLNTYETVMMARTDAQGQTQFDLQQNDAFYKFIITDKNGKVLLDTIPSAVFATAYSLKINTGSNPFNEIKEHNLLFSNLSFSNISNSFTITYNDPKGLGVQTCLIVDAISFKGVENTTCNSCSSSSSATLVCDVTTPYQANKTLIARAYTYGRTGSGGINSTAFLLDELIITPAKLVEDIKDIFGSVGVFMGFLVVLTMIMIGLWNPIVAMILGTLGFVSVHLMGLITLGTTSVQWIVGIVILAGILAYRSRA